MNLKVGGRYTKNDLYEIFNVPPERQKGPWNTGYLRYDNNFFIFANIDIPGRTGHNYQNKLTRNIKTLIWYGKTGSHVNQPIIRQMLSGEWPVLIFTRHNDRDAFVFRGFGANPVDDAATTPIRVTWEIANQVNLFSQVSQDDEFSKQLRQAKNDNYRQWITLLRRKRNGHPVFKNNLAILSEGRCSISLCEIPQILQACHLIPHAKSGNNNTSNGLLLRSDIHDLFDGFLIGINPNTGEIAVKDALKGTEYYKYKGRVIDRSLRTLNKEALIIRWVLYQNDGKMLIF